MKQGKAVVLVSGGMDSLVTAAVSVRENKDIFFLHLNYGQKTQRKEAECFRALVKHYKPKKFLETDLDYFTAIGGSSLTDKNIAISDHDPTEKGIPSTYVPFRNAQFLSIAVSWAEVIGAGKIYIGAVEEDSTNDPVCRKVFFEAFQHTIDTGTKGDKPIEIVTPLLKLSKAEIVKLGNKLHAPFEHSWSCYRDNVVACGTCDSCVLRLKGFRNAGLTDPITYRKR